MRKFRTRMRRNQLSVRRGGIGVRDAGVELAGVPGARGGVGTFRLAGGWPVRSGEVMERSLPKGRLLSILSILLCR